MVSFAATPIPELRWLLSNGGSSRALPPPESWQDTEAAFCSTCKDWRVGADDGHSAMGVSCVTCVLQMTFILGKFYGPLPSSSFHVSGVFLFRVEHVYPFQNEMLGATPSLPETQSEARDLHRGDLSLGIRGSLGQGHVRASGAHVTPRGSFPEGPWSGGRGSRAPSAHESSVPAWPGTSSRLCKTC